MDTTLACNISTLQILAQSLLVLSARTDIYITQVSGISNETLTQFDDALTLTEKVVLKLIPEQFADQWNASINIKIILNNTRELKKSIPALHELHVKGKHVEDITKLTKLTKQINKLRWECIRMMANIGATAAIL